jgi:tetratricopeptide (TPR) repeat protein
MLSALRDGFRSVGRSWGLVVLVLVVNLALALVLAVPLARQLERDLARTGSSSTMMYGFDYDWWSRWSEEQDGVARSFGPEVFGRGLVFRNLDLLLRGHLPAGLFPEGGVPEDPGPTANLATVRLRMGRRQEAADLYRDAAGKHYPPAVLALAGIARLEGRTGEARALYESYLRLDPGNELALRRLREMKESGPGEPEPPSAP